MKKKKPATIGEVMAVTFFLVCSLIFMGTLGNIFPHQTYWIILITGYGHGWVYFYLFNK